MNYTYVISGYMRCGTSMMMKALEAGGMETAFDPKRDELNEKHGDEDYKPNPGGFYEMDREEYIQPYFPKMYRGKLLKCLWGGFYAQPQLMRWPVQDEHIYRIAFMRRNPEEIRQSFEAFFGKPAPETLKMYPALMQHTILMLQNRRDVEIQVFSYRDVVNDPLSQFGRLAAAGWPVDVMDAAAVVDPDLCRFRLENLTVGI